MFNAEDMKKLKYLIWSRALEYPNQNYAFPNNCPSGCISTSNITQYFIAMPRKDIENMRACLYPKYKEEFEAALLELQMGDV